MTVNAPKNSEPTQLLFEHAEEQQLLKNAPDGHSRGVTKSCKVSYDSVAGSEGLWLYAFSPMLATDRQCVMSSLATVPLSNISHNTS